MKIYLQDHNGVLMDVAKEFEVVESIEETDVVVLWQDVIGLGKAIAKLAHIRKKPVVVMQHGIHGHVDYCSPISYPLLADKICVWGPVDKENLLKAGIPEKKIALTGTTIFKHLKPRVHHKGINIVFRPAHWDIRKLTENDMVMAVLKNIKGINIITKIIETHDESQFINPVYSHRDEPNHLDICADVLSKADLVIGVAGDGTFELMAYILDIPVVIADVWRDKFFLNKPSCEMIYTKACDLVLISNLEQVIKENLKNPNRLQEERKFVAVNSGGITLPRDPLEKIVNVIKTVKL